MYRALIVAAALVVSQTVLVAASERGPETNLPLPRFVSMKASEGNVRRGPSLSHRIDWVFKHRYMPLQVVAEYGNWRRVIDREGAGGWMHYTLLSGVRTVRIDKDMIELHKLPNTTSPVSARTERGVIARLGRCDTTWCQITTGGTKGWARRDDLWGLMPGEVRE